jgi:hypothetical protein
VEDHQGPAPKVEVNHLQRLVTRRLEWRNEQWGATLESLDPEDQTLWSMTKRMIIFPTPFPPGHPGESLSQILRERKPLQSLEAQFQPVFVPSVPVFIEMVDVPLRYYFISPAREPKLTSPDEFQGAIRGLRSARLRALTVPRTGH